MSTRKTVPNDPLSARALFSSRRLRLARDTRRLTQTALADQVGVSPAAISQYEAGDARPAPDTLASIARVLEFPVDFFALNALPSGRALIDGGRDRTKGYFRSLRSTSPADRNMSLALAEMVQDVAIVLDGVVRLPALDVPSISQLGGGSPESAAALLRAHWGLAPGPIPNVVEVLESHGVVCARYHLGSHSVDAFSVPFARRPVVVLGDDKDQKDRERFSAAHELGHLVVHTIEHADIASKAVEGEANAFAAEFLMPAEVIVDELPQTAEWDVLLTLKVKWQVSLGALLFRAKTLGRMSPERYTQAMKYMSMRGWRRTEPGNLGPAETPRLLGEALNLAVSHGTDLQRLSTATGWPLPELQDLLRSSSDSRPTLTL